MQKNFKYILPVVLVTIAALGFAGWRMWGMSKSLDGQWPALDGGVYAQAVTADGLQYLVPPNQVYTSGLTAEDRPALNDPDMVDIQTADEKLADELEGISVSVGEQHRFYPFQILNWHEVVNTEVNGVSLVITYSALTGSAVVYQDDRSFSDAGKVYNDAMLMKVDGDEMTLWNQTSGQMIVGESVGERLLVYPSTTMSWATWKDMYPSGLALSTDTGYVRDYGRHPYASYETTPAIFFPINHVIDSMEPKDIVYRVENGETPVVFMRRYLPMQTDPNTTIGSDGTGVPIVAFYDEDNDLARVFNRTYADGVLTFTYEGGKITDNETGSRWSPEGVATSGELRGTALTELPVTRHYAFAHFAMYPNSVVSGQDILDSIKAATTPEAVEEPVLVN